MKEQDSTHRSRSVIFAFYWFLKHRFDLDDDKADELKTIEYMERNVEFKGANLWILIFAVIIASVGLNVNSTAVIIGAMLISPLMSPILGIGLSIAINDLDFLRKSLKNLSVATVFSVAASTLYFLLSPLSDAQSELLARTNPTIWDVLIAFFGGLAGMVAGSRNEKSNAIPGVAIATALMPPLCTAGYGIATGNLYYFLGAFYLFFINGVFISLGTFLIVRLMNYPQKEFADVNRRKRVRAGIAFFVLITILPSIYLAYRTVQRSVFERNAMKFIAGEIAFKDTRVIASRFDYNSEKPLIEISLFGRRISEDTINALATRLPDYRLGNATLNIFQGQEGITGEAALTDRLRRGLIDELYRQNQDALRTRDEKIDYLERQVLDFRQDEMLSHQVAEEAKSLYPSLKTFTLSRAIVVKFDPQKQDTAYMAVVEFVKPPARAEINKLNNWLKARVNGEDVEVVVK